MFELLTFPFMQRALLGGLVLGALLAALGVFVTMRRMSFFGDGIAHASLAGIAIAILLSVNPVGVAVVFSIIMAILVFFFERHTRLGSDTILGILFTASMAVGVLLIHFAPGYQPELMSFLFGNILAIGTFDVWFMVVIAAAVAAFLALSFRQLTLLTFDRESAYLAGIKTNALDLLLYCALAVSVVLGVKLLGVILVSGLLIMPPSIARFLSRSFTGLMWYSIVSAEIMVTLGLIASVVFDVPSGAAIIVAGFCMLILVVVARLIGGRPSGQKPLRKNG